MRTDLAGRGRAAPEIGAEKAKWKKRRGRLPGRGRGDRLRDGRSPRRVTTSRNDHFTPVMSAMVDCKALKRIQAVEERAVQRDREVAGLFSTVSRLKATVEAIRASTRFLSPAVPLNLPTPVPSAPSVSPAKAPNAPSSTAPDRRPPAPPVPQASPAP
jgi:hypothetical protein